MQTGFLFGVEEYETSEGERFARVYNIETSREMATIGQAWLRMGYNGAMW